MANTSFFNVLLISGILFLCACTSSDDDDVSGDTGAVDAGSTDTGSTDAGSADIGLTDAGSTDAESTDAGVTDAGSTDAGSTDAGSTDAGSTDAGSTDAGSGDNEPLASCSVVNIPMLQVAGGSFSGVLPADLSATGSQIELLNDDLNQFIAFDPASGAFEFLPGESRLASVIEYQVKDSSGAVLSTHEHRMVFTPVRIMPLGDSITSGVEFFDGSVDLPPMPERVGYRQFLFDNLTANGYEIDYLGQGGQAAGAAAGLLDPENNGFPGVDIAFINGKLIELLTEDSVDIILLHIGTNGTPATAQGIDDLLDTLDTWEAANQPVLALVATIVPKRNAGLNAEVEQFNQDIRTRIAARSDDLVLLVEQFSAVTVSDLSAEPIGLHPSATGYEKMADAWFTALTNIADDPAPETTQSALFLCE